MANVSIDEAIAYSATNRVWGEMTYNGTTRMVFPYSYRVSKSGNPLMYAYCTKSGHNKVECFRRDRIEHFKATSERIPFSPEYPVELDNPSMLDTNLNKTKQQPIQQPQNKEIQKTQPIIQEQPLQPTNPITNPEPVMPSQDMPNLEKISPVLPIGKPTVETVVPLKQLPKLPDQSVKGIPNV
jgi:hypothetical protein